MASDITPEAIGFLSAVGVFVVVLAVLFLFINKKLCFSRVGGLPCLEQYGRRKRAKDKASIHQGLDQDTARQCSSGALIHDLYLCSIFQKRLDRCAGGSAAPPHGGI
ncbi:synaptotagmin-14-like isoform X2 [Anguilla rostrata]|uniref:synaptotagmin-14-like isoform X2 n=1 Tax=Anguilla rostrata TaxID=7938 RepID=UPI0030CF2C89